MTSSSEGGGVLDGVVQQRGAQGLGVEPHAGADLGHTDRVGDEVLAGLAALVGVVLAGEHEGGADARHGRRLGDLVGVLLDDREQVGGAARARARSGRRGIAARAVGAVLGAVDRAVRGPARARRASERPRRGVAAPSGRLLARALLIRYRRPSSSRRWYPGRPRSARAACARAVDQA